MPSQISTVLRAYMQRAPEAVTHAERCLAGQRWYGSTVLQIIDAAFTSVGLNYFTAVIPRVQQLYEQFVLTGRLTHCRDLAALPRSALTAIWKNQRSWHVARAAAAAFAGRQNDRAAFRCWAAHAPLPSWQADPIGSINGVGINTYQYLRMMGGANTLMPDRIVQKVVFQAQAEAGCTPGPEDCLAFIAAAEELARAADISPAALCWMTWLLGSDHDALATGKYGHLVDII